MGERRGWPRASRYDEAQMKKLGRWFDLQLNRWFHHIDDRDLVRRYGTSSRGCTPEQRVQLLLVLRTLYRTINKIERLMRDENDADY